MSIADLKKLPVASIADDDCFLFLWATMPKLQEALAVMKAWGLQPQNDRFRLGQAQSEERRHLLGDGALHQRQRRVGAVGTRGKPKRVARDVKQIVLAPRGRHSEKPEEVRRRIEQLTWGAEQD